MTAAEKKTNYCFFQILFFFSSVLNLNNVKHVFVLIMLCIEEIV